MKKKRTLALLLAGVMLVSAGLTGCKGKYAASNTESTTTAAAAEGEAADSDAESEAPAEDAVYKDTLTVAVQEDAKTLDSQECNKINYAVLMQPLYDQLVHFNWKENTYEPQVATSWELVDDTTMVFHLRDDVYFHNGEQLTAEDVLYTYKRATETALSASTFSFYDAENSRAIDDFTVEIKLNFPYAQILDVLSGNRAGIVCKKYVEEVGSDYFGRNPIGSGPYKFVSWTSGTEIRMERNEEYWGEKAQTKNLVFKVITEAANRVIELETGNVDAAYEIAGSDVDRINATDGIHVEMTPSYRYYTITFSMQDEVTSNQDLRYALSYALDKESLVNAIFAGTAETATGFYPSNIFGFKDFGVLPYDLDKAKEYLEKAGYPDGLTLKFDYEPRETDRQLAEAIQNMWAKIGVELEMYEMDSATYVANGNTFQVGMRNGNAGEPSNILIIYDSSFADKLQGNDDWLDEQLALAKTLYDDSERAAKYQEIQDYLYEKRYTIPFAFAAAIYGVSDKVQNWELHPNQMTDLSKVRVLE